MCVHWWKTIADFLKQKRCRAWNWFGMSCSPPVHPQRRYTAPRGWKQGPVYFFKSGHYSHKLFNFFYNKTTIWISKNHDINCSADIIFCTAKWTQSRNKSNTRPSSNRKISIGVSIKTKQSRKRYQYQYKWMTPTLCSTCAVVSASSNTSNMLAHLWRHHPSVSIVRVG